MTYLGIAALSVLAIVAVAGIVAWLFLRSTDEANR